MSLDWSIPQVKWKWELLSPAPIPRMAMARQELARVVLFLPHSLRLPPEIDDRMTQILAERAVRVPSPRTPSQGVSLLSPPC